MAYPPQNRIEAAAIRTKTLVGYILREPVCGKSVTGYSHQAHIRKGVALGVTDWTLGFVKISFIESIAESFSSESSPAAFLTGVACRGKV